ncbi:hypothetical protein GGH99_000003 [Coemansia sp. RSA 1285]|nr:hypothetical protein GGH99_000003 [Coemansia sp. RSA 1285]
MDVLTLHLLSLGTYTADTDSIPITLYCKLLGFAFTSCLGIRSVQRTPVGLMASREKEHSGGETEPQVAPWKPGERVCSLEDLYRAADIRLSRKVPVSKYFRDLEETLEKAKRRLMDQDLQYAYVFYMRYVTVVIKHLPHMPDYNNPEFAKQRERTSKNAKKALTTLERLQPILQQRYEEYARYLASVPRAKAEVSTYSKRRGSGLRSQLELAQEPVPARRASLEGYSGEPQPKIHLSRKDDQDRYGYSLTDTLKDLNIGQNRKSSVDTSTHDRRAGGTRVEKLISYPDVNSTPSSPPSISHQQHRHTQSGYSGLNSHNVAGLTEETIPKPLPQPPMGPSRVPPALPARPGASVSSTHADPHSHDMPTITPPALEVHRPAIPPKPKGYHGGIADEEPTQPSDSANGSRAASILSGSKDFMPPCIIGNDHQSFTEGGVRMRPIQMPEGIFEEFLDIAEENTRMNLETCGILCGKQIPGQEALVMTTLIIPKQSATSDTCSMENEEELFAEQEDRDLLTLGWIHTHPSQTCFMSSLDLHTHHPYQLLLPEAIAIVCSPKYEPHFGIFRLTDPFGMDVIQKCPEKTPFHLHNPSKVIYTSADTGGHVVLFNYDFDIIDIRGV